MNIFNNPNYDSTSISSTNNRTLSTEEMLYSTRNLSIEYILAKGDYVYEERGNLVKLEETHIKKVLNNIQDIKSFN